MKNECFLNLSLSLMLRPTVSRPVCYGIKHLSGAYDQNFATVRQLRVCWCGELSLTRGQVCRLQLLLALASAVILGSESRVTPDHILLTQIRDFLFVASYDSQGYGGGIRPRLHAGEVLSSLYGRLCSLTVSMEKVRCLFLVYTETRFVPSCSLETACMSQH
jgi:hypothetical protein